LLTVSRTVDPRSPRGPTLKGGLARAPRVAWSVDLGGPRLPSETLLIRDVTGDGRDEILILGAASIECRDARGVRLWVRDSGPGVPPEDRDQIFERFGRSEVAADDEGFGLGLSIVGAIARAHGGTVTLEDEHPSGARFVITLPRLHGLRPSGPAPKDRA